MPNRPKAPAQDFGSGLTPSTTLRVTPAKRLKLSCQRALKIGLGAGGQGLRRVHPALKSVGSENKGGAPLLALFEKGPSRAADTVRLRFTPAVVESSS
jgi:hypothetical protein